MKSILALAILILAAIAIQDCEAAAVGEIEPEVREFPPHVDNEAFSEEDNEVDPKVSQCRKKGCAVWPKKVKQKDIINLAEE